MKQFMLILLLCFGLAPSLWAEQMITLKDGSQIKGELVSFINGVYTIKTASMGQVTLTAGNIVNIADASSVQQEAPRGNPAYPPVNNVPYNARPNNPYHNRTDNPYQDDTNREPPLSGYSKNQIDEKFKQTQQQVMSNPAAMADIQSLAQDPEIMKILSDPDFMQSVTRRDLNAVSTNPRTQQLLHNPKMKALLEKIQAQQQ